MVTYLSQLHTDTLLNSLSFNETRVEEATHRTPAYLTQYIQERCMVRLSEVTLIPHLLGACQLHEINLIEQGFTTLRRWSESVRKPSYEYDDSCWILISSMPLAHKSTFRASCAPADRRLLQLEAVLRRPKFRLRHWLDARNWEIWEAVTESPCHFVNLGRESFKASASSLAIKVHVKR